jgi:predicted transcriptional regulator
MARRTPLDDVEYLAGSGYRVEVLRTFAGGAYTRPELHERTGIPQPTLGCVLSGLEERGWIRKKGREYHITPLGDLLTTDFESLLDTVETVQSLAAVEGLLPLARTEFDLRALRDARVTTPSPPDVFAHFRRGEELVGSADDVRTLVSTFMLDTLPKQREWILNGQREEVIMTADAFDEFITHPEAIETAREVLATGRMRVYRYEGEVPVGLTVADDVAVIVPYGERNVPAALVETTDERVYAWVSGRLDE